MLGASRSGALRTSLSAGRAFARPMMSLGLSATHSLARGQVVQPVASMALRAVCTQAEGLLASGQRTQSRNILRTAIRQPGLVFGMALEPSSARWFSTVQTEAGSSASTAPPPPVGTKVPPLPKISHKASQAAVEEGEESITGEDIPDEPKQTPMQMVQNGLRTVAYLPYNVFSTIIGAIKLVVTKPAEAKANIKHGWGHFAEAMKGYWLGTKLLAADVRTATRIFGRVLKGYQLTRREKKQLLRTVVDLLRLVPMAVFVVVPFMEFLLPVALKLFPNMLPSTFQTSSEKETNMKKMLKARLQMADFLTSALQDMASDLKNKVGSEDNAAELLSLIERVRQGEQIPVDRLLECAQLFKDELTLDNVPREQLAAMAKYMGLPAFGSREMIRFQLHNHLRSIKEDDKQILWEGIDELNRDELRQACQERGMRATGLSKSQYKGQLQHWLDLSVHRNVPASLLIMSRVFLIHSGTVEEVLQGAIKNMDEEVLAETLLDNVGGKQDDAAVRKLKLDITQKQNELIAQEAKEAQEAQDALDALAKKAAEEAEAAAKEAADQKAAAVAKEAAAEELVVEEPESDIAVPLSAEEAAALLERTPHSALAKERELLENMSIGRELIEAETMRAMGRIGSEAPQDMAAEKVKKYLDSMLSQLELDVVETEKEIGSKLQTLDLDHDGFIKVSELSDTVRDILGPAATDKEVWRVVRQLDEDGDGIVPVTSIHKFAKQREIDMLEELHATAVATAEAALELQRRKLKAAKAAAIAEEARTAEATTEDATPKST